MTSKFPASNFPFHHNSLQSFPKSQHELNAGNHSGTGGRSPSHITSHSRPRPSYRSSSPARHAYQQHSRSSHSDYSPLSSPAISSYTHNSLYARRPSSPLTSSSPGPVTSPPIGSTRLDNEDYYYEPDVQIAGRDMEDSYLFRNDANSLYFRRNDENLFKPKLPSFKSLFGTSELQISPVLETTLPPIKFPLQNERKAPSRTDGIIHPVLTDTAMVVSDIDDFYRPTSRHSYQTPRRSKKLISDAESPKLTFYSPSKNSPYPRRIYFLESSERDRTSPVQANGRCDLHQLAEIAHLAQMGSSLTEESPEHAERSSADSASSPFSSPVAYRSSLPPSSPPTSEVQISPVVNVKELVSAVAPLADAVNMLEFGVKGDSMALEGITQSHESLKSSIIEVDDKAEFVVSDNASSQQPTSTDDLNSSDETFSAVIPSGNKSAEYISILESDFDLVSTKTDLVSSETVKCDQPTVASPPDEMATETVNEECILDIELPSQSEDNLPRVSDTAQPAEKPRASSIDVLDSVATASSPPISVETEDHLVPSGSVNAVASIPSVKPRQFLGIAARRTKLKSSTASPMASSAPRVTVTVVKRMKPIPNTHRNLTGSLTVKSTGKEKEVPIEKKTKDVLKTRTSEVVNSHPSVSKRPRDIEEVSKERSKGSEVPLRKKVKITGEEDELESQSLPSSLADAISSAFEMPPISPSESLSVKRKADDELVSTHHPHVPHPSMSEITTKKRASHPASPSLPKTRKVMILELPVLPKRKPAPAPAPAPASPATASPAESENPSWLEESWVDALAAAYGSPAKATSSKPTPSRTPSKRRQAAVPTLESDLSSDEELDRPKKRGIKSPKSMVKRRVIESDSEDGESDMKDGMMKSRPVTSNFKFEVKKRRPSKARGHKVEAQSSDSDSEPEKAQPKRLAQARTRAGAAHFVLTSESDLTDSDEEEVSDDTDDSSKPTSKPQKFKTHFPSLSPLDLELVGIIIETMSLSRSSSHLASTLYRTVKETRGGIFAKLIKDNPAHFDAVGEMVHAKGLASGGLPVRKGSGRAKRGVTANDEGGVAGMSEGDIVWVSEFERVMVESASRCGMFGMVESSFRNDPRDLPLPFTSRFFYVPDCDPDTERAQLIKLTMPGAGKRSETKKYKQYYWKPVAK